MILYYVVQTAVSGSIGCPCFYVKNVVKNHNGQKFLRHDGEVKKTTTQKQKKQTKTLKNNKRDSLFISEMSVSAKYYKRHLAYEFLACEKNLRNNLESLANVLSADCRGVN